MSEENTLVPELRFPEFQNDGEWKDEKLGNLGYFLGGGTPDRSNVNYWTGNIPWISSSDISENDILNIYTTRFISENAIKESATKIIPKGSVLFVSRVGVGKLAINKEELCTSQDFTSFVPKTDVLNFFIGYYFSSNKGLLQSLNQGTSIKGFSKSDLENLRLPYPKILQEQQKIASCLSSLDEVITAHSQKLELLKEHKKSLMQNLFPQEGETVPRYRFPEFANDGAWEEMQLGDAVKFNSGTTPSKDVSEYWNGNIPWISASSMHNIIADRSELYITDVAVKNGASISKKGSILILVRGSMLFKRIPICIAGMDVSFNQDVKALELKEKINNVFLLYLLISNESKLLESVTSTGIGAGKLDTDGLKRLSIKVPYSNSEQQKIVFFLSSLDKIITAQTDKLEQLKLHKKGLMQGLFPKMNE